MTKLTDKEIEFKNLLIEFLYENAFKTQIDLSDEEAIEFIEKLREKGITIDENRKISSLPSLPIWEFPNQDLKDYWESIRLKNNAFDFHPHLGCQTPYGVHGYQSSNDDKP